MATVMKTPGVYIVELNAFPNSVVEVATAVPAFIGYTEKADNKGTPLANVPWRISSMAEFRTYFGGPAKAAFTITDTTPAPVAGADPVGDAKAAATAAQTAATAAKTAADAAKTAADAASAKPDDAGLAKTANDAATAALVAAGLARKAAADAKTKADAAAAAALAATAKTAADTAQAAVITKASAQVTDAAGKVDAAGKAADPTKPDTETALLLATNELIDATTALVLATAPPPPPGPLTFTASWTGGKYALYSSMLLFFQNGGGPCYIVSVGTYTAGAIVEGDLLGGIDLLLKEQEPTMVVMPDAVYLPTESSCIKVQQAALLHCGDKTKSRFAVLDIYDGFKPQNDPAGDCVAKFRGDLGINNLDFAAAYYPWLNSSVVGDRDVTYQLADADQLTNLLRKEAKAPPQVLLEIKTLDQYTPDLLHKTLSKTSDVYVRVMAEIQKQMNLLPPSGAIAGVYSLVDGRSGVWKAPANVSLNSVISPTVSISDADQENLNVDVQGKSINAIRSFIGEGVLVWGARTLDGNSLDWRYIGVRRTMIFLEQSIKLATKAYVFENNVSTTWVTIKSMIRNFLTGIWKRGGLAGAIPDDAFAVFCGLGETMTADDILEGILRVTVLVAVTRPAEFIEITFQQQMQKS